MRITFLGSSHGVPEANRRCSSTLVEIDDRKYLVDVGTNAIEQLVTLGVAVESINTIFVSHMHGDHTDGLIPFLDLCSWYFKNADPDICLPQPMNGTIEAVKGWLSINGVKMRDFRFHEIGDRFVWDDGVLRLTAIQTKHTKNSFAFLLEAEGKRVLFTGDLSHKGPEDDFPVCVFEKKLDLAICEAAHFSAMKYLPIFENNEKLDRVCITHYQPVKMGSAFELDKAIGIPVMVSSDGLIIDL